MAHHLGAETVVTEEYVADAGYQNVGRGCTCLELHSAHLQIPPGIRYGTDSEVTSGEDRNRGYANRDPTHYFHDALLSVSGSTSSGAKYK